MPGQPVLFYNFVPFCLSLSQFNYTLFSWKSFQDCQTHQFLKKPSLHRNPNEITALPRRVPDSNNKPRTVTVYCKLLNYVVWKTVKRPIVIFSPKVYFTQHSYPYAFTNLLFLSVLSLFPSAEAENWTPNWRTLFTKPWQNWTGWAKRPNSQDLCRPQWRLV